MALGRCVYKPCGCKHVTDEFRESRAVKAREVAW